MEDGGRVIVVSIPSLMISFTNQTTMPWEGRGSGWFGSGSISISSRSVRVCEYFKVVVVTANQIEDGSRSEAVVCVCVCWGKMQEIVH